MIYGIVAAIIEEVELLIEHFFIKESYEEYGMKVFIADYLGNRINIVVSGVGKVNSARATQYIIDKLKSEVIINIGSAGSLCTGINIGDVVVACDTLQYDVDFSAINLPLGEIPFTPICSFVNTDPMITEKLALTSKSQGYCATLGRFLTADLFLDAPKFYKFLQRDLGGIAVDAETAAIGQVACLSCIPFVSIRVISNEPLLPDSGDVFEETFESVAPIPQKILMKFFE